jgi:hypothetical protein
MSRIVVIVRGGVVTSVYGDDDNCEVEVIDCDIEHESAADFGLNMHINNQVTGLKQLW